MIDLTEEEKRKMQAAMEQTDGIFALEGFTPTEQRKQICAAILAGKVTHQQVIAELLDFAKQHKTVEGFVESRTWK